MSIPRFAVLPVAVAAVAMLLTGCSAPAEEPITFAVAGDSLTAWDDQTFPEPDGDLDPVTWTHWVIADGLELAGGYARGFATARDIADRMVAVDADVLVVMVGTNDTGVTDTDAVLASIDEIVATAGARAVLISAIPPDDGFAGEALLYNLALVEHAADRDWAFVDPWADMRVDGVWGEGLSSDGIHPTAEAASAAGDVIADAIRELVGGTG
jgi:lysophospholipase L1-like esterase